MGQADDVEGSIALTSRRARRRSVVLRFPHERAVVDAIARIREVRFDWDARHWTTPMTRDVVPDLVELLDRFPRTTTTDEVDRWLGRDDERWIGRVATARHRDCGWWTLERAAGELPAPVHRHAHVVGDSQLLPFDGGGAALLRSLPGAVLSDSARRCLEEVERGRRPPAVRVEVASERPAALRLDVFWDERIAARFRRLAGWDGALLRPDVFGLEALDAFVADDTVEVSDGAARVLASLGDEAADATGAVERSSATTAEPIPGVRLGGTLQPFQWAGVRYALAARRCFIADEQGLGKTVQALAALEAEGAFPAVVVCPASLRLNWQREAARWLAHRSVAVISEGGRRPPPSDIVVVSYELLPSQREALAARGLRALVVDEAHYVKNPRARRTQAVRALASAVDPHGLRLALTGTPVVNHAAELVAPLRILDRLAEFGSGAAFVRWYEQTDHAQQRLHWELRRRCFVRRLKSQVLPQLPDKRRVGIPVAIDDEREYRLAERSVVAWLRAQPLDPAQLDAKLARTLRAERLARLAALLRLVARGKLRAATEWIESFLASGEPLVVFARHREVQQALLRRFSEALHLLGDDSPEAREATVRAFQAPDGPQLVICSIKVAGQGLTLTRASNVCFLELEWSPAVHDQAEDRCHRIGQRNAVTAWYLLAAGTIDETIARLLDRKRDHIADVTEGRSRQASVSDELVAALRGGLSERDFTVQPQGVAQPTVVRGDGD